MAMTAFAKAMVEDAASKRALDFLHCRAREFCHLSLKWWWHHAVGLGTRAFPRSWIHPGQPPHPRPTPPAPSPQHRSSQLLRRCHRFFLYLCQSVSRKAWDNYVQCIVLSFKKAVGKLGCIFNGVLWYMSTHTQLILYMYIYITIFTHQRVGTKVILLRDNWGMDGWFMTGGMDNLTRFDRFSPPKVWGRLFLDVLWMRYSYQQPKVE